MNNLAMKSLELLQDITSNTATRKIRSLDLLKQPEAEYTDGWFMCVKTCFNSALDIRITERIVGGKRGLYWTQGAFFAFKPGDVLYDTIQAYTQWSEALKHIRLSISVREATEVRLSEDGQNRFPGSVTFSILKPNEQRTALIEHQRRTMTQDEFVAYLIAGEGG